MNPSDASPLSGKLGRGTTPQFHLPHKHVGRSGGGRTLCLASAVSSAVSSCERRSLSHCQATSDQCRLRRQQWQPRALVEAGIASELGIAITVNHLPPGTSKWNRIEHKLFAFITMNWRAKPLVSYLAIIQLIASTTTETGLRRRLSA